MTVNPMWAVWWMTNAVHAPLDSSTSHIQWDVKVKLLLTLYVTSAAKISFRDTKNLTHCRNLTAMELLQCTLLSLACNCSNLAVSAECDRVTGRCQCQPGAIGLKCDDCAFGFTGMSIHAWLVLAHWKVTMRVSEQN